MELSVVVVIIFFLSNDTATTEIYTLSLHDALPISARAGRQRGLVRAARGAQARAGACWSSALPDMAGTAWDRKSTRLNSSHVTISYAVFCLKKKIKVSCAFSRKMRAIYMSVNPCNE